MMNNNNNNNNRAPLSESSMNSRGSFNQQEAQANSNQQQQQQHYHAMSSSASSGNNNNNNQMSQQQQQQPPAQPQPPTGEQMSQLMCATELTNLLLEFAFSVFVNKPQDIVEYAASYFQQLRQNRRSSVTSQNQALQQQQQQQKRASSDSQRSQLSQNSFNNNNNNNNTNNNNNNSSNAEDNDDFEAYDHTPGKLVNFSMNQQNSQQQQQQQQQQSQQQQQQYNNANTRYNRRKSVFAEAYDPAADQEDDENNRVVHGKTDEQRIRLAKAIESIFLFRSVDQLDMTQILDAMFEVKVAPGDVVIKQGDDGDNFYVVERGKFQIYFTHDDGTKQIRGEYEDNGSFGELALMYNQPRAASVIALSDGSLWAMDRKTFRRIVLKSAFKKRKEYEALFEKVSVLQCLNGYERMNLCDALQSRRFKDGEKIICQGEQANGMYFIESGNVKIIKEMDDGRVIDVAILGKGDYFGELALINHKPRAATVSAIGSDVKLAFLDVKAFERLLGSCIERMEKNCAMYLSELAHNEGRQNV